MNKIKLPSLVMGVFLLGLTAQSFGTTDTPNLKNQIWIDRFPQDDRDMITLLVILSDPDDADAKEGKGVILNQSQWKVVQEIFLWNEPARGKSKIIFNFPQTGMRQDHTYRVWPCGDETGFDLCLDLQGKQFFSFEEWIIEDASSKESILTRLQGFEPLARSN